MMAALDSLEDFVRDKVENEQWTYARLSTYLQQLYPGERGYSIHSLERFCQAKDIYKASKLSEQELEDLVADNIDKVGSTVVMIVMHTSGISLLHV